MPVETPKDRKPRAHRGHIISPLPGGGLLDVRDGLLFVDEKGRIAYAGPFDEYDGSLPVDSLEDHGKRLILPGFIDLHIHLPQVTQTARSGEHLLQWLDKYIFPAESRFSDLEHAEKIALWFFDELVRNGTTTAVVFTTIHKRAADCAFAVARRSGIRAVMGKVMMDENAPEELTETASVSLEESFELYEKWHGQDDGRLLYAYTPRFAVTSSRELLAGVGELLEKSPGSFMHTHLSESTGEIEFVARQFPGYRDYVDVYDRHGLLGERSILAHAIHLSDGELKVLADRKSVLAHCPSSNFFLKSGVFQYTRVLNAGIRFGLGSDVAAGPQMSMFGVMKDANYIQPSDWLTPRELFYRSTLAGAEALGLAERTGSLEQGKEADFIIVDPTRRTGIADDILEQTTDDILSSMVFLGDDRIVISTFVRGECLFKKNEKHRQVSVLGS